MMNKILNILLIVLLFVACKTSTTIDPPKVQEIEDATEIQDDIQPQGKNQIIGQIKGENNVNLQGAAIKLTLNNDTCVNSYSDFDGKFIIQYDKELVSRNDSKFEILYEGHTKKIITFKELPKNNIIFLDKKGDLVKKDEYKSFHEAIRACTR